MRGNQIFLNSQISEHEDNPIKENIGDVKQLDIIYVITDEYWKEWRRQLTFCDKPNVKSPGLGYYSLMYGKSKSYLRKLLVKIRTIRAKRPDEYMVEGTRAYSVHQHYLKRFRATWKQVDSIKKEVNRNLEIWKNKKIEKYGDKAII